MAFVSPIKASYIISYLINAIHYYLKITNRNIIMYQNMWLIQ